MAEHKETWQREEVSHWWYTGGVTEGGRGHHRRVRVGWGHNSNNPMTRNTPGMTIQLAAVKGDTRILDPIRYQLHFWQILALKKKKAQFMLWLHTDMKLQHCTTRGSLTSFWTSLLLVGDMVKSHHCWESVYFIKDKDKKNSETVSENSIFFPSVILSLLLVNNN